jgi:hypothetical protein
MYGLVNKAIEGLIRSQAGDATWEIIKTRAGVQDDFFVGMQPYPDALSYQLVGAASEVLGVPGAELLEKFGEYWVLYVAQEGYGHLLGMAGNNLKDVLLRLDNLHAQVGLSFPKLQPPSFRCSDVSDNSLTLHYYSERAGLAPMVMGLVKGLGKRLNTTVAIRQTVSTAEGADHDEFQVEYQVL